MRGAPAAVAFLSWMLKPNDACNEAYKGVLGDQLAMISPTYYDNRLFNMSGPTFMDYNWDICQNQSIRLPLNAGTIDWHSACPWRRGKVLFNVDLTLRDSVPSELRRMRIHFKALNNNLGIGAFEDTLQWVTLDLEHTN